MVKRTATRELLKRLDNIQTLMQRKSAGILVVSIEEYLASDASGTFSEYITEKTAGMSDDTRLLIDDMSVAIDIYLPSYPLFEADKNTMQKLVRATGSQDKRRYMEIFVQVFESLFEGNTEPVRDGTFCKDFMEHYKTMSADELVERYENQKFFRMPWM